MSKAPRWVRILQAVALLGAAAVLAHWFSVGATPVDRPNPPATSTVERDRLLDRHDCWTGQGPADTIPGHAVVTPEGSNMPTLAPAADGFAIWQDDAPGVLHGFCP